MKVGAAAKIELMTGAQSEEFEAEMEYLNFVIGRYVFSGANVSQIICPNQDEMLKHAREYNSKMNRKLTFFLFSLTPTLVETVLFKEVNAVNKQVTYMFQKDSSTVVKMTVAQQ